MNCKLALPRRKIDSYSIDALHIAYTLWMLFWGGLLVLFLASCQAKEEKLSFETIEKEELSWTGTLYESSDPGIITILNAEEITKINKLITDKAMKIIKETNYKDSFVIAVFQGNKPTTGYGVNIEKMARYEQSINIFVSLTEPKPNFQVRQIVTSPYQIVEVPKYNFLDEIKSITIYSGQKLIAKVPFSLVNTP
jgi:hypothetical protein